MGDGRETERLGDLLVQFFLTDFKWRVIRCNGCEGMGRWRIAEEAAMIAMERGLFDLLIWVKLSRKEWSARNLQMRIAKHLEIEFPSIEDDTDSDQEGLEEVADAIRAKLKDKSFLLVVGEVCKAVDLGWVGVPSVRRIRRSATAKPLGSKILLIGNAEDVMPFDQDFHWEREYLLFYQNNSDAPFDSIKSNVFLDETADVAHSSMSKFTQEVVIDFLRYLFFFDGDLDYGEKNWLAMYWIAQGFINTSAVVTGGAGEEMGFTLEEEVKILMERMMNPLLRELCDRSLIDERHKVLPHIKKLMQYAGRSVDIHKFWVDENSLPRSLRREYAGEQWKFVAATISTESNGSGTSLPPSPEWSDLSTLLIRCGPQVLQLDIPPFFFQYMSCLRVLHLRSTPIPCLPSSISSLCGLRLLRLHGCDKLTAIPSSLKALEKLEFLDFSKCESLEIIPDEVFERMSNLRVLDLSSSKIKSLPSSVSNLCCLQHLLLVQCESIAEIQEKSFNRTMRRFEVLDLSGASSLTSLPSSLSNLVGLKKLILNSCRSLKNMGLGAGAHSLSNLSKLEVLDLGYCLALEDIEYVSFGDLVPNIKKINLRRMTTPKRLSFQGCRKLEHLDLSFIECLEVLNLSGTTQLKKFYFDTSLEEHPLRHLDLLLPVEYDGVRDVVPFEGLNWDDNDVGARIWLLSNEDIFKCLPLGIFSAKCFSRFHILISSSTEERPSMPMPMGDFPNILFQRNQFVYKDIYSQIQTYILPNFRSTYDQHLEIIKSDVASLSLERLLPEAKLLTLYDNSSNEHLLPGYEKISKLKECRIGSCRSMETVFDSTNGEIILECLEVMWVSDLSQLTTVCKDMYGHQVNLAFLKHMHLERCPKLVIVFSSRCHIERLETLEIKFCSKLEVVFERTEVSLQSLRSLCLLQLPKLESIGPVNLPKLQKMRVRGCRMLRKLPLGVSVIKDHVLDDASDMVEIEGETNWWKNLQWANEDHAIQERPVRFRPARSHVLVKQRK